MKRFKTRDSTLAYYVNQLENLDRRFYEPLLSVSWGRDIKLRSGITLSDESTSFIRLAFAGGPTLANPSAANMGGQMPWVSGETNDIPGVSVTGQKLVAPLRPLAREISYTSIELARSQKTGMPIDVQKINAFNEMYQMNTDQMVYIGSSDVGATGMVNDPNVVASNVATGLSGGTTWQTKSADEILDDVNALIESTWSASAFDLTACPHQLRLPPFQFSLIAQRKVSSAGNVSILQYLKDNSISLEINGAPLDIKPVKWLTGRGAGSTDRMMAYTNEEKFVRFPMVSVQRETAYYQGIRFIAPYLWLFGQVEFPYYEPIQYADGI